MTLKLNFLIAALLLCGCCAFAGKHRDTNKVATWMKTAFGACIDAQIFIKNPLLDAQARKPKSFLMSDYVVSFAQIPKVSVFNISVDLIRPFPDASSFSCRLDKNTHTVVQAAFFQGEPESSKNKEVNLVDHDPLGGVSESELNSLMQEESFVSVPLADFYE